MTEQAREQGERLAQYRVLQKLFAMTESVFVGSNLPRLDLMIDLPKVLESQGKVDMVVCFRPQGVDVSLFNTHDITPAYRAGSRATLWSSDNGILLYWDAVAAEWRLADRHTIGKLIDRFIEEHKDAYNFPWTREYVCGNYTYNQ